MYKSTIEDLTLKLRETENQKILAETNLEKAQALYE